MRTVSILFAMILSLVAHCDVGGDTHMKTRSKKIHGTGGYKKSAGDIQKRGKKAAANDYDEADDDDGIEIDTSPETEAERTRFKESYKYAYDNYFAATIKDRRTGEMKKQSLGKFHMLMIDYDQLDIIDEVETYSVLPRYLPEKNEQGEYPERWLYFRTLDDEPEIQDGPTGPISERFYKTFWQGVTIRICGDARTRCMLAPRNHLKSSVGGYHHTTWRSIREPSERTVIRCVGSNLAKKFLTPIKQQFESNKDFIKLFGHLKSEKRDNAWNTEAIQFNIPPDQRRGVDPTVQTAGAETDMTGTHGDNYVLDDIVAKTNSGTPALLEGTRAIVTDVHAQRDEGSLLCAKGTRWHDDDAYSTFVGQPGANEWSGSLAPDSCFFVATVLDGDESVKVPPLASGLEITPLRYGKPIWPEGFGMRRIESTRRGIVDDYHWRGQYFNQFIGTQSRTFNLAWIRPQKGTRWEFDGFATTDIARKLKLNIFMAVDTASGKADQKGKLDRTACFVGGQTPDKRRFYLLDGFREKITAEHIAIGIVDKAVKWHTIAKEYDGIFQCGIETHAYTNFLQYVLSEEQKKRGSGAIFSMRELKTLNRHKWDRIGKLASPYCDGAIIWPFELIVKAVMPDAPSYDLRAALEAEFKNYNRTATEDDLIDAHAYAYEMSLPGDWKPDPEPRHKGIEQPGGHNRRDENDEVVRDRMTYEDIADRPMEMSY